MANKKNALLHSSAQKVLGFIRHTLPVLAELRHRRRTLCDIDYSNPPLYVLDGQLASDIESKLSASNPDESNLLRNLNKPAPVTSEDQQDTVLSLQQKEMLLNYMKVMENMESLKTVYFDEFLNALHMKMQEQESLLEKRSKRQSIVPSKSMPPSRRMSLATTLSSKKSDAGEKYAFSDEFINQLIRLQETLIDDGKITCKEDMEEFWYNLQAPLFQRLYFKALINLSASDVDYLAKNYEVPIPEIVEHWAVRAAKQRQVSKKVKRGSRWNEEQLRKEKEKEAHKKSNQPSYMEAKPFPALFCMRKKPSLPAVTNEQKVLSKLAVKEQERKKARRQVAKMYNLALANEALSTRLLRKHKHDVAFNPSLLGVKIADIIAQCPTPKQKSRVSSQCTGPTIALDGLVKPTLLRTLTDDMFFIAKPKPITAERDTIHEIKTIEYTDKSAPLSMAAVAKNHKVLEAKLPSGMWGNYTRDTTTVSHDPIDEATSLTF